MRVQHLLVSVSCRTPSRPQVEVQLASEQEPERPQVIANDGGAAAADASATLQSSARDSISGRRSKGSGSTSGRRRRQQPIEAHDDEGYEAERRLAEMEAERPAPSPAVQSSNPLRLFQASAPPPPPPPAAVPVPLADAARPVSAASNRKQPLEYEPDSDDDATHPEGPAGNREHGTVNPRASVISQEPSPVHLRAIHPPPAAGAPVAVDWESFRASYDSIQAAVAAVKSWGPPEVPHASASPAALLAPDASGAAAASPSQAPLLTPALRSSPRMAASSAMRQDTRSQGRSATPKRVAWSDAASPSLVDDEEEEDIPPPPPLTPSMMVGSSRASPLPVNDNAASAVPRTFAAQHAPSADPTDSSSQAPPLHVLLPLPLPPPTGFAPSPPQAASPQMLAVPQVHAQSSQDTALPSNVATREKDVRSGDVFMRGASRGPSPPPAAQPRALIAAGSFFAVGTADAHPRPEYHARPTLQGVTDAPTPHTQYLPPALPGHPGSAPALPPNASAEKPPRAAAAAAATTSGGWKWSLPLGRLAPSGAQAPHAGPPPRILPVDPDAVPVQPPPSQQPVQPPPPHLQQHPPFPVPMPTQPPYRMHAAMPVVAPAPLQYGGPMRPPAPPGPPSRVASQAPPPFHVAQLGAPQFQQQPRPLAHWNAAAPIATGSIGAQQHVHGRRGSSSSTDSDRPGAMPQQRATWAAAAVALPPRGLPATTAAALPLADSHGPARGAPLPFVAPAALAQPPGPAAAGMSATPVRFSDALSSANDAMGLIMRMQQRRGLA